MSLLYIALICASCSTSPSRRTATTQPQSWTGVYATSSEIGGFAGTVLVLEGPSFAGSSYRMQSYSDAQVGNSIPDPEPSGSYIVDGDVLYLPLAYGYMHEGKPSLRAAIKRYTRVVINSHSVLMRDDAYKAFRSMNKLYDYGILIKVSDVFEGVDLKDVKPPSIKTLYADPNKPWADPFVSGPNPR